VKDNCFPVLAGVYCCCDNDGDGDDDDDDEGRKRKRLKLGGRECGNGLVSMLCVGSNTKPVHSDLGEHSSD